MIITYKNENGIYVNLTNRCTNNCDFCVRTQADGIYGNLWLEREPSKEEVFEDVMKRDLSEFTELVFCGYGEPTVRLDDMLWIAGKIKEVSQIPIRVNTNGHANLIYGKDVTPLLRGKLDVVSVSLNTANADEYVKICHPDFGAEAYQGLLDFAELAKKYVPRVMLSIVRGTIPDADIDICQEAADKIGVELRIREMIN